MTLTLVKGSVMLAFKVLLVRFLIKVPDECFDAASRPYLFFMINIFKPFYDIVKNHQTVCVVMCCTMRCLCALAFSLSAVNGCMGLVHHNASWEVWLTKQNQYGESSRPRQSH